MKETQELIKGLLAIAAILAVEFKDGVQAQDAVAVFTKIQANEALKAKLVEAYNGANLVTGELKDASTVDQIQLLMAILPEIRELMAAVQS